MYHELTVWSRGIIMDKEARDVSSCIAATARALGYYADNVSDYVDDPDRTNCLVRRYARFGDSPIVDRFVYENPHPDWVVLVEETIIKAVNFLRGTPERGGVVVVNSVRDPDYLLKFLPDEMKAKMAKFVVVDAVGLAEQRGGSPWMFVRNLSELALRPDVHRGRRGAARDRDGHRRPAHRRADGRYRRTARGSRRRPGGRPGRHAARRRQARGRGLHRGGRRAATGQVAATPAAHATHRRLTRSEEAPCPSAAPGSRRTCSCPSPA